MMENPDMMKDYVNTRISHINHQLELYKHAITEPWDLAELAWEQASKDPTEENKLAYETAKEFCMKWAGVDIVQYTSAMKTRRMLNKEFHKK